MRQITEGLEILEPRRLDINIVFFLVLLPFQNLALFHYVLRGHVRFHH